MAPRPQHPAYFGQDPGGLLEVVEHVDAPHEAHTGVGQRQAGGVGYRHRRLQQRLSGTVLVVLYPDGIEAGGTHPAQPVAPAASHVEDGPVAPEVPQVPLQPLVEGLVDIGRGMLARTGRQSRHKSSDVIRAASS